MTGAGIEDPRSAGIARAYQRIESIYPDLGPPSGAQLQAAYRAIETALDLSEVRDAPPAAIEYILENVAVAAIVRAMNGAALSSADVRVVVAFGWWIIDWFRGG